MRYLSILLTALMLALTGCVYTQEPLFTEEKGVDVPEFVGSWQQVVSTDIAMINIEMDGTHTLSITSSVPDYEDSFTVYTFERDGWTLAERQMDDGTYQQYAINTWENQSGTYLSIAMLDSAWFVDIDEIYGEYRNREGVSEFVIDEPSETILEHIMSDHGETGSPWAAHVLIFEKVE